MSEPYHWYDGGPIAWQFAAPSGGGAQLANYRGTRVSWGTGGNFAQNDQPLALALATGSTYVYASTVLRAGDPVSLNSRSASVDAAFGYAYLSVTRVADETGASITPEVNYIEAEGGLLNGFDWGAAFGPIHGGGSATLTSGFITVTDPGTYEIFGEIDYTA